MVMDRRDVRDSEAVIPEIETEFLGCLSRTEVGPQEAEALHSPFTVLVLQDAGDKSQSLEKNQVSQLPTCASAADRQIVALSTSPVNEPL